MTENPYTFLQKKTLTTALNDYLTPTPTPCFIVSHLAHIYFIAEIAKKTSFIIKNTQKTSFSFCLLSPPNAATYLGIRWWLSFVNKAVPVLHQYSVFHILDCFDHAGLAMAALRLGQKHILFDSTAPQIKILHNRAAMLNAMIIENKPNAFSLLDLSFKKKSLFK